MFSRLETIRLTFFKQFVVLRGMNLKTYMEERSINSERMAELIGKVTGAGVRLWMTGARMPSAEIAERIFEVTDRLVTVQDMHETRLEYLTLNPKSKEAA